MRDITARSLLIAILVLAGCGRAQHASAAAGGASPSAGGTLTIAAERSERGVIVATVAAPAGWLAGDALSRGDDLTALVDEVRAKHPRAALRIEVTQDGSVVASADSPTRGRVTFSMKK